MMGNRHAFTRTVVFATIMATCAVRGQSSAERKSEHIATAEDGPKADDANDPRRASLIADTRKMLALSREVRAEMAKNGTDTLSLALIKKVEELQRLAARIKAKIPKTP